MSKTDAGVSDWLIVKRDLYFRSGACGYTGIRDEAGRYSYEEAQKYERGDGITIVRLSDAPEFRQAAYSDLVTAHLIKQRDEARAAPPSRSDADNSGLGRTLEKWLAEQEEEANHCQRETSPGSTVQVNRWNARAAAFHETRIKLAALAPDQRP